jgi:hypothetical protein
MKNEQIVKHSKVIANLRKRRGGLNGRAEEGGRG